MLIWIFIFNLLEIEKTYSSLKNKVYDYRISLNKYSKKNKFYSIFIVIEAAFNTFLEVNFILVMNSARQNIIESLTNLAYIESLSLCSTIKFRYTMTDKVAICIILIMNTSSYDLNLSLIFSKSFPSCILCFGDLTVFLIIGIS